MPIELISILAQIPIVAAFIWFALELLKRTQDSMDKRDAQMQVFLREQREADRGVLARLISKIEEIDNTLTDHDRMTRDAVAQMRERTQPRSEVAK